MNAALIDGGTVVNVIVLDDDTRLTGALAETFGGTEPIKVAPGVMVGPGWGYDANGDLQFTAPPTPHPPPPEDPPADPAAVVLPALAAIAADATKTRDQRVDAILAALAAAAPIT